MIKIVIEGKDAKKSPKNWYNDNNGNNNDNRIEEHRIGVIAAQIVTTTELFRWTIVMIAIITQHLTYR
jgi:hypothetical protein